jgi:hypothetical protein
MSETPLSDRITAMMSDESPSNRAAFCELLLVSRVGVTVGGLPEPGMAGIYTVGRDDRVTMRPVSIPDGRRMVKAGADPPVFARHYDASVNAEMLGRDVLEMVLKMDDVAGVLVCSAASFHSVPIFRKEIQRLLGRETAPRSWWKLW